MPSEFLRDCRFFVWVWLFSWGMGEVAIGALEFKEAPATAGAIENGARKAEYEDEVFQVIGHALLAPMWRKMAIGTGVAASVQVVVLLGRAGLGRFRSRSGKE